MYKKVCEHISTMCMLTSLSMCGWVGAGALHKLGADFFCHFFLASIFQPTECSSRFFCADFRCADFCAGSCAHSCADFWCADCCADFCADFWRADFCADFRADFPQMFWCFTNRCSRVTQKCVENLRRPNGLARGGYPIPSLLSRADSTSRNRCQAHVLKESM